MAFVKLDTGILNSTLWIERDQREVFITALLMAEPREFERPIPQIKVGELEFTGFKAPPGWYGFVPAASVGIIRRAGVDIEPGMEALRKMGEADIESRSKDFDGRRMIRIDGGFLILNYMKYRDKDHTAALRQQRLRDRRKVLHGVTEALPSVTRDVKDITRDVALPDRNITQSDADADASKKPSRKRASKVLDRCSDSEISKTVAAKARHAEFKAIIQEYWDSKNRGVQMPWDGREGKHLEMFLRAAPDITADQFRGFLRNRYKSEVNHGERASQWIDWVASYAAGPIDRFGKTMRNGNGIPNPGTDNQHALSDADAYATWQSMSAEFRKANPWQGGF